MNNVSTTKASNGVYQYTFFPESSAFKGIHVYILDKKHQRIGVFAATTNELYPNEVFIGWSKCNESAGDRFDSKRGVEIAYERSRKCSIAPTPFSMQHRYEAFRYRCQKYFKNKTIV